MTEYNAVATWQPPVANVTEDDVSVMLTELAIEHGTVTLDDRGLRQIVLTVEANDAPDAAQVAQYALDAVRVPEPTHLEVMRTEAFDTLWAERMV